MASDYPIVPLGNVAKVRSGFAFKSSDWVSEGIPVVKITNVKNGRLEMNGCSFVTHEVANEASEFELVPGDILIAMTGYVGDVALVRREDIPSRLNQRVGRFTVTAPDQLDSKFLFQFLRWSETRQTIEALGYGSAQPNVSPALIHNVEMPLPPFAEQRAIANILGVLDDKIELNRRMNETLEGLARAIFQSWFVDFDPVRAQRDGLPLPALSPTTAALFPDSFEDSDLGKIPKGWETAVLDDVTGFLIGGDWGKESNVEDATEAVLCIRGADIPSLQSGGVGKMPTRYLTAQSLAKRRLREGDIVFEISGGSPTQSTGRPVLATAAFLERLPLPLTCSNFCRLIRPADGTSPKFLYGLLRRLYAADEFLQYENGTTGIKNLAFTVFSSIHRFVRPSNKVMAAFEVVVSPIYAKMAQVGFECEKLAAIRDALLPKLLSGEIRIGKGEERRVKT